MVKKTKKKKGRKKSTSSADSEWVCLWAIGFYGFTALWLWLMVDHHESPKSDLSLSLQFLGCWLVSQATVGQQKIGLLSGKISQ